jgi:hypothetical protein
LIEIIAFFVVFVMIAFLIIGAAWVLHNDWKGL